MRSSKLSVSVSLEHEGTAEGSINKDLVYLVATVIKVLVFVAVIVTLLIVFLINPEFCVRVACSLLHAFLG